MSRYMQRPENALKRANEFIAVGKPARALETLYDVFRNKKWVYTWSETLLEPIMFKYLDLCVELKKSLIAKEGLFQYRNMFQTLNVNSLENVIRGYLRMAEEKTEAAREQSQQAVIEIDDLDNLATPESILLSAVSGEDAQDRSDRTILTPWVKFLWESYCQCLELLRTNSHCETLYHDIARMAFSFCLKYNRKTEFRKLCDKLRKHLEDISKLPVQVANVSINKPETQQYNLETRLVQLDSAIQMELWQEAYKAIEDIHGLMNLSKKLPVPKTMANYYLKLAMVFWKAGYYLFHAAALFKLFTLSKEMKKNITPEELQRMACRVLLATLCIPLPSAHPEFDRFVETDKSPLEKAQRLAILLTLQQPPTRASLIKDLVRMNIVQLASPQLQELYQCMEVEFNPLTLCNRVKAATSSIKDDEQYVPPLQDVTLVKLIRQVSQIYQTIKFERLYELAVFTTPFHLERLLVDSVRHNDMQIRIDHRTECVHFGMDLSESPRESAQDGPILQSMPSDQLRMQLVNMSNVLHSAVKVINPDVDKVERDRVRHRLVREYRERMIEEHQRILERHKIIEDRKEFLERLNTAREEEEARRAEEVARQQAIAEQRRLDQEREERERRRQENEIQQIKDRHLREKMQQISQTAHGQKLLKKLDEMDIKKLDADQIAAKEAEELQRERKEMLQKLKSQEKKVDYFERAKRLEEIPILQEAIKKKLIEDQKLWEELETRRIETLIMERQKAVETQKRLALIAEDKDKFLADLKIKRHEAFMEKLKPFEAKVAEERMKRLALRKEERISERRAVWEKQQEEEKKRIEEEERERQKAEEKKRLENLERQAEIQRKKEEEVARRLEEKEKALQASWRESKEAAERDDRSWRKAGAGGGAPPPEPEAAATPKPGVYRPQHLREREKEREPAAAEPKRGGDDRDNWRRGGGGGEDRERDLDRGFGRREMDRGGLRKGDREEERDRGIPRRGLDDRDMRRRDDRGGMDRDRERGGMDRDRERGGMDRDRERGGMDRDRERGGMDRDRERGGGMDRERDGGRRDDFWRGGDRDRDRDMDRGSSSFRDRERDRDRMERRPPTEPMSSGSWRRGPDPEPEARRPETFRKEPPPPPKPADKGEDSGEDDGWEKVTSKR